MENNENIVTEQTPEPEKSKGSFKAGFKEWLRKTIVNLKRRPSNIGLVFVAITAIIYLLSLGTYSQLVYEIMNYTGINWAGFCVFACTLLSILVLVTYMGTYPKRVKITKSGKRLHYSYPMMVLTYVFMALMIFFDIMFLRDYNTALGYKTTALSSYWTSSQTLTIVHIVFTALSAIIMATMPLYKKLIMKINTSKVIESAASSMGALDLEDEG